MSTYFLLQVDINKIHVNFILMNVDKIIVAYMQKYATKEVCIVPYTFQRFKLKFQRASS